MKSRFIISLFLLGIFQSILTFASDEIPPYYRVASSDKSISDLIPAVKNALTSANFEVIGEYNPGSNDDWYVIAFTRKDLQDICLKVKDRGALASVLKVGFVKKDGKTQVSFLNPMYLFYAYLMDEADTYKNQLTKVENDVKTAMNSVGTEMTGFGGGEEPDDLKDYHYMMMMPYFTNPVELNTFSSFEEGLKIIRKNLEAQKGNAVKVYEVVFADQEIAVIGVGLLDAEEGESHFLPIIGPENIAAMPYEIIIQGKEATMLHGKYRFALHWPELSMSQFMKIVSTPGDVEDTLEGLTEN
ncbi:MAG: hypothetical protein R2759_08790 [Bacteroidales bacterium]